MADEDTRVKIAAAIEAIDDAKGSPATVIATIAALSSERPRLVMDLTDPPTQPYFVLGDVQIYGVDADDAARALGAHVRPHLDELARAAVLPDKVDIAAIASAALVADAELAPAQADVEKVG